MTEDAGGFDPIDYYNKHRKVPDDAQLSEEEYATLLVMDKAEIDALIDLDYAAWELQNEVKRKPSAANSATGIKRVGASSY